MIFKLYFTLPVLYCISSAVSDNVNLTNYMSSKKRDIRSPLRCGKGNCATPFIENKQNFKTSVTFNTYMGNKGRKNATSRQGNPWIDFSRIPQPNSLAKIAPRLIFYTKNSTLDAKGFKLKEMLTKLEERNMYRETAVLLTHGFLHTIDTEWLSSAKTLILKENDYLVVLVGWGGGANLNLFRYTQAVANTQAVGNWLAEHVKDIQKEIIKKFSKAYIWGIGHSLGAHVMGSAGRISKMFNRITGLDPAGPSFETTWRDKALRSDDAKEIVDVIHTDGFEPRNPSGFKKPKVGDENVGTARTAIEEDPGEDGHQLALSERHLPALARDQHNPVKNYGTLIPCGTVDFYPNWGYRQPATFFESLLNLLGNLSHLRAVELFLWSIGNPGRFTTKLALDGTPGLKKPVHKSVVMENAVEMGFHYRPVNSSNTYYVLSTKSTIPWK